MSAATPLLDDQLCFDLYAASRSVTAAYRPVLDEVGLTYPQYLVLLVLWERDGATVSELGTRLRLDHGTLTPLLRRMEASGLVTRRRRAGDERYVEVTLAGRGEALREHGDRIHCRIREAMGLGVDEMAALQGALRRLTANVGG